VKVARTVVVDADHLQDLLVEAGGHDQQLAAGLDRHVGKLRMQADRQVGRDRPRRGGPDDEGEGLAGELRQFLRELVDEGELDVDRRRGVVGVFHLGFGQRGDAGGTPVHGLLALVQTAALGEAGQLAGGGRLVAGGHRQVGMFPVAEDAETSEFLALDVDPLLGVGAALLADLRLVHLALFAAEFLVDLELDRQAVTVPAGHVGGVEALHALALDDHVLENLVQGVADVNVAVGVGRAVVEDEFGPVAGVLLQLSVEAELVPAGEHLRFPFRQVGAHGEIGEGKVEGLFVVHAAPPAGRKNQVL